MVTNLLILGASTRAAAFSARRAGLIPVCADLFADQDLVRCCTVTRLTGRQFPDGFERVARDAPPGPWLYVGGLENYPDLVARISSARPLWGNGADVLRQVRDPFQIAGCLAREGLPCSKVRPIPEPIASGTRWLRKPIAGAGGRGIREHVPMDGSASERRHVGFYFQQRVSGQACAAVFVGDGRSATLIGLTQQLVGDPALCAKSFQYCGSIGPLPIEERLHIALGRLGHVLAAQFGLMGLFGVDGILKGEDFWPVEVNPRYTASVEVLEFALGLPLMNLHRDACARQQLPAHPADMGGRRSHANTIIVGKAILFAPGSVTMPDLSRACENNVESERRGWLVPQLADIPATGEVVHKGHPICTVFATHKSVPECHEKLMRAARRLYRRIETGQRSEDRSQKSEVSSGALTSDL